MSWSRIGPVPLGAVRVVVMPGMVLLASVAGGCASKSYTSTSNRWSYPGESHQVAAAVPKPEMEDDGQEAQLPPLKRSKPEPDDPREPYSPNYGRQSAQSSARVAGPARQSDARDMTLDPRARVASGLGGYGSRDEP